MHWRRFVASLEGPAQSGCVHQSTSQLLVPTEYMAAGDGWVIFFCRFFFRGMRMHGIQRHTVLLPALVLCAASWAQTSSSLTASGELVLGRYSTQSAEPAIEASEPLDVVAQLSFPRANVRTIGDAIRHTLLRTGYELADTSQMVPEAGSFLNLPLPESQREVGPYRVKAILDVLTGSTWQWQRDPLRRRLKLTIAPAYEALLKPATTAATTATTTASEQSPASTLGSIANVVAAMPLPAIAITPSP